MKHDLYKITALAFLANTAFAASGYAQTPPVPPTAPVPQIEAIAPHVRVHTLDDKDFKVKMKDLDIKINDKLKVIDSKLGNINFNHRELAMLNVDTHMLTNLKGLEHIESMDIQPDYKGIEKSKVISKSYSVDRNDKLAINNQFGTVSISTWNKNEIKVDIEIKAYESSESAAQDLLDNVTINDSKQPNLISFKTDIKREGSRNWFVIRKNGVEERKGVQVSYVVYMPSRNPLDITNEYGNTVIPDFEGELNLKSTYGTLSCKNLKNLNNTIKTSYCNIAIESMKAASVDISYGSFKLGSVGKLNAEIKYTSPVSIGSLNDDGMINVKYGSGLKIEHIDDKVKNLNVNAAFSGVNLGFEPTASFNFDVTVGYSAFKYDTNKVNISSTDPDPSYKGYSSTKNYKGTYGKGSDARVIIKSAYGAGVKFL